eukprot:5445539-Amphidinium_carterae.1
MAGKHISTAKVAKPTGSKMEITSSWSPARAAKTRTRSLSKGANPANPHYHIPRDKREDRCPST